MEAWSQVELWQVPCTVPQCCPGQPQAVALWTDMILTLSLRLFFLSLSLAWLLALYLEDTFCLYFSGNSVGVFWDILVIFFIIVPYLCWEECAVENVSKMLRAAELVPWATDTSECYQQAGELHGRSAVFPEVRGQGVSGSVSFHLGLVEEEEEEDLLLGDIIPQFCLHLHVVVSM